MYTKKTYRFRNAVEVQEYHSARYGAPGQERRKKAKPTPEQVKRVNQWNKERRARHRLWMYFDKDDYFTTLTYGRGERPGDMQEAGRHFSGFLEEVRKQYKKRGAALRWMRNIEAGKKNGWHIHIIINRIPDTDIIIASAWKHGHTSNKLLYTKGEFAELAAYITKTPETDPRLKETDFSTSRNMPLPEPGKKEYRHWGTWEGKKIRVPKGFYLDGESLREGRNPVTGYPYRTYIMYRTRRIARKEGEDKKCRKARR